MTGSKNVYVLTMLPNSFHVLQLCSCKTNLNNNNNHLHHWNTCRPTAVSLILWKPDTFIFAVVSSHIRK